jgi:triphosphoribosyl-dephospho-CoA synthase
MNLAQRISQAAQLACMLEVVSPKPGNVDRQHDFHNTHFEDYLLSAVSIGPPMQSAGRVGIGRTILRAIQNTRKLVTSNTNLGIVLLLAPLAKACFNANKVKFKHSSAEASMSAIRKELVLILKGLTVQDARLAYQAIRLAQPGGMGHLPRGDISEEPDITLLQAMELVRERDSIAREYVTGFEITFDIGYPALQDALKAQDDTRRAMVQTYLTILSKVPDTLIGRKRGLELARQVSRRAQEVLDAGGIFSVDGRAAIATLDLALRDASHSMNPGTTADLTAAAAFLVLMENSRVFGNRHEDVRI